MIVATQYGLSISVGHGDVIWEFRVSIDVCQIECWLQGEGRMRPEDIPAAVVGEAIRQLAVLVGYG